MADFCKDCANYYLGADSDFEGICEPGETTLVLCEGCGGFVTVDYTGERVDDSLTTLQGETKNLPKRIKDRPKEFITEAQFSDDLKPKRNIIKSDKYGDIDEECFKLCEAINRIPGLETFESCCGHGKHGFWIWLIAKHIKSLFVLERAISNRYGGPGNWRLLVDSTDCYESMPCFWLQGDIHPDLYEQANEIADEIDRLMGMNWCIEQFINPLKEMLNGAKGDQDFCI